MSNNSETTDLNSSEAILFSDFLAETPPNTQRKVISLGYSIVTLPEIKLYCDSEHCKREMFFGAIPGEFVIHRHKIVDVYLNYSCRNCNKYQKSFSVRVFGLNDSEWLCTKYGELPPFGPNTPARLINLIGPDREVFLKGRRCESQGLGIGAFSYYRRVVENQKNRIFDEIIRVAKKLSFDSNIVDSFEQAKTETQFKKAVESIKNAIPEVLLISGHNPLTLLHQALSDGLHDRNDDHCLELASSIRVVLGELSERIAMALKDDEEVSKALGHLMKAKPQQHMKQE